MDDLIDYLIREGEAVEYGERWTNTTTHEWWRDAQGKRHCRLVMTGHGGGSRGDNDEAEYASHLLALGRAVRVEDVDPDVGVIDASNVDEHLPVEVTHFIEDGRAKRFRYYVAPPEGLAIQ